MNFYKHYIGDFNRDTGHLSLTEKGAYLALIHHYYATELPLPVSHAELCRIAGAITKTEQDAVKKVIRFFERSDSGFIHIRIEAELEKAGIRADKNRAIAVAREAKRRAEREARNVERNVHESCSERDTNGARSNNLYQTPDTREEAKAKSIGQQAARFDDFWLVYPNKKGKADAMKAWKRKRLDAIADQIITDVLARAAGDRQWLEGYIPHGSTYVNGEGWQDAIEPSKARVNGGGYVPLPGEV